MPNVSIKGNKGVIRWDQNDWLTGLVPSFGVADDITQGPPGFVSQTAIHPYRAVGYLSPGYQNASVTNDDEIDGILKNGISDGQYAYIVGGTKIYKLDTTGFSFENTGAWSHAVTAHGGHSSVVLSDIVKYNVGSTEYAFYSWNDNTDGDIGRFDLSSTFDDDYMSTVAASGAVLSTTNEHPMIVGADDILYIADGNVIQAFDGQNGANGTYTADRFTLPKGFVITSFAKSPTHLVIFAYRAISAGTQFRSESVAYFWNYIDDDPDYVYKLDGNYVNGAFEWAGTIGCFVQGQAPIVGTGVSKTKKLMLFDGSRFKTVVNFTSEIPTYGGVEVFDDTIFWNAGGQLYQWGGVYPGYPRAVNKIMKSSSGSTSGMLRNFDGSRLYMSSDTGVDLYKDGFHSSSFQTTVFIPDFPPNKRAKAHMMRVYWKDLVTSTGSFDLQILINRGLDTKTVLNNLDTVSDYVTKYWKLDDGSEFPTFDGIALKGSWSSSTTNSPAVPGRVELHFELEEI